jgi:hypothetical protein
MVVAPSAGRWYAGEVGTVPILVRGAGVYLLFAGA